MVRDYGRIVAALRRKAADPAVSLAERKALLDKAEELSSKISSSPPEPIIVEPVIVQGYAYPDPADLIENGWEWDEDRSW